MGRGHGRRRFWDPKQPPSRAWVLGSCLGDTRRDSAPCSELEGPGPWQGWSTLCPWGAGGLKRSPRETPPPWP